MIFVKIDSLAPFQIRNQIILFALLFYIFKIFAGIDNKPQTMPFAIKKIVKFLSKITLEIYVVQYVIIPRFGNQFMFPQNWLAITATIIVSAAILHWLVKKVQGLIKI